MSHTSIRHDDSSLFSFNQKHMAAGEKGRGLCTGTICDILYGHTHSVTAWTPSVTHNIHNICVPRISRCYPNFYILMTSLVQAIVNIHGDFLEVFIVQLCCC